MRQLAVVAHGDRHLRQADGVEIEHRLGLGLVALGRIVALEREQVSDAERRGRHQVALQRDPIAVAASELKDRLDAVLQSMPAAVTAPRWARAPAPSVTLTASARPLSGSALAMRS